MVYKKEKFTKKKWIIFIATIMVLSICIYFGNNLIKETYIEVSSSRISRNFQGYKIVHLSDLHNKSFGKNQKNLVDKIQKIKPDVIFITGDIIDSRRYNEAPSLELVRRITSIATVYYVPGNHEMRSGKLDSLQKKLKETGCIVLRNESDVVTKNGEKINIVGVDDPQSSWGYINEEEILKNEIDNATRGIDNDEYKILLSHRPEKFSLYVENNIDITFSGHAHGGQVRIPFIGAIIAPHQGFFPKYSSGMYKENESTMIVSRGLGNSLVPVRIFNRPEIVVVTLDSNQ